MPIPFAITAISGNYHDIAGNYHEKNFIYLIEIFYLRAPSQPARQSHHNGFIATHLRYLTAASWAASLPLP
jgi:hypothetical protein